jgi:predicted acyltransferase
VSAGSTPGRDPSLDAFRGLTVMLMMLVNLQGPAATAWAPLVHAAWHGLTPADLVFPWFLLIVGLSVPIALAARPLSPAAVLRRAALLFGIGVVLGWLIRPSLDPEQIRWMGVLQRIALVYLACMLVARRTTGWRAPLLVALLCLGTHAILLGLAPPDGPASLDKGAGLSGWLDRTILPGRLYPPGWDPEGVLSTLGAVATGLLGLFVMRLLQGAASTHTPRLLIGGGAALCLAGAAATHAVPLNKALWTPSFALLTAGLGLLLWVGLQLGWPAFGRTQPARLLVFAGRTALTAYILHMLLIALLVRTVPGGGRLWDMVLDALATVAPVPALAGLAFALAGTAASLAVTAALARRGWTLRL